MRLLFVAAALVYPAAALANGRPPVTNAVQFRPGDHDSLYVSTTFGLLVSSDDGDSFRWLCERNIGYGAFEPKYRIAADGAIFATTYRGLRVSRDGGCSFATATETAASDDPGRIADRWIDAIDIGPTGDVWVATADSGRPNNVYRSTDNGVTFAPRGMLSQAIWWKSVVVAPSRARRVYLTGYQVAGALPDGSTAQPTAHVAISDDAGARWAESPLAGVAFGMTPVVHVVAVDRTSPDTVFLSSRGSAPPSGDRLYRSTDGGMTWSEVLMTATAIVDVAVASTGELLIATFGGTAYQSTARGAAFSELRGSPQLRCLGARDDGAIYGCGANWEPDHMAVARSTDGKTWHKVFRFVELAGPVDCPADTSESAICGAQWPAVKLQFGATGPVMKRPAAGASFGSLGALAALAAGGCLLLLRRRRG
jgi:photosystem II stability/assembly factor-like uncharacterized protein